MRKKSVMYIYLLTCYHRMFVVGHHVSQVDGAPEIAFDIVGSTGNLYRTVINRVPNCSCKDNLKGNQCKHICYGRFVPTASCFFFFFVLNQRYNSSRDGPQSTRGFAVSVGFSIPCEFVMNMIEKDDANKSTCQELVHIYQNSPLARRTESTDDTSSNRRPIEGECPICYMEFEPDSEEIVWCRARCGNNVHRVCFTEWAKRQNGGGQKTTCVFWLVELLCYYILMLTYSSVVLRGKMNMSGATSTVSCVMAR